jgi:hypothetical protein
LGGIGVRSWIYTNTYRTQTGPAGQVNSVAWRVRLGPHDAGVRLPPGSRRRPSGSRRKLAIAPIRDFVRRHGRAEA